MAQTLWPCSRAKRWRERIGLGIQDEVDLALAVQQHVLVAVLAMAVKPMRSKTLPMATGSGCRVFDEFEAVGAHGVVPGREGGRVGMAHGRSPEKSGESMGR